MHVSRTRLLPSWSPVDERQWHRPPVQPADSYLRASYGESVVAQAASELWGSEYGSNQLYGEDLCAAAAQLLGENPYREPWY